MGGFGKPSPKRAIVPAICQQVLSREQRQALRAIAVCRTPALGGHVDVCTTCGLERAAYHSCRNRHCPKCQSLAQARWISQRMARRPPTPTTSTSSSRSRPPSVRSRWRNGARCSRSSAGRGPDPAHARARWEAARRAARHHRPCSTPGPASSSSIPTCTASSPAGASPPMGAAGSPRAGASLPGPVLAALFRGKFLAALSAPCDSGELRRPIPRDRPAPSPRSHAHAVGRLRQAARSAAPRGSSSTSAATPTASASPINGSSP